MSRGKAVTKLREFAPDLKYKSVLLSKFINKLMLKGKKEKAAKIVYLALEAAVKVLKKPPLEIFETALKNASPLLEVRTRRIGGATYQVPMEVPAERRLTLAMRWIIAAAREKRGKNMIQFLTAELIDAYNNTGTAVKKKEELHKTAEANRAFAHFARF